MTQGPEYFNKSYGKSYYIKTIQGLGDSQVVTTHMRGQYS